MVFIVLIKAKAAIKKVKFLFMLYDPFFYYIY